MAEPGKQLSTLVAPLFCFALIGCAGSVPESMGLGKNPIRAVIVPDGSKIYVANYDDSTVSIISIRDTYRLTASTKIRLSGRPNSLLVAQDGKSVYIGLDRGPSEGAVEVLDVNTRSHTAIASTNGPVRDMVWSNDAKSIYLAMEWGGLGKLRLNDNSVAIIDRTACPEGLAITSGGHLFVSYQCAPGVTAPDPHSRVGPGHDPIRVFSALTDSPEHWITSDISGGPFPNVGGLMSLAPDEKVIWENGNDACSRKLTAEDAAGYDFDGCGETFKDYRSRGVINVIGTQENSVVATKTFPGKLPGSDYRLGASLPTFFPAVCHFAPNHVAVSTEQDVLIYNAESVDQISLPRNIPRIPRAGSVVFSPKCDAAYIVSFQDDALHVRAVTKDGTFGLLQTESAFKALWVGYRTEWRDDGWLLGAAHSAALILVLYVIAFASPQFASVIGRWPILSKPLEVDVLVRGAHSVLLRLYLNPLRTEVSRGLQGTGAATIVALPMIRVASDAGADRKTTNTDTDSWGREFAMKATDAAVYQRVAVTGKGGQGKSVFVQGLIRQLLEQSLTPVFLKGPDYNLEPSLGVWIQKIFDEANVPLQVSVLRSVPSLIVVIDGVSEVADANREQFWRLIQSEFGSTPTAKTLVVAGRFLDRPDLDTTSALGWNELLTFEDLNDDVIKRLGIAYLDPGGPSAQIEKLPETVRRISSYPTAFIVSRYVLATRASSRPIASETDLYNEILDSYVSEGKLSIQPRFAKEVLKGLVMGGYGTTKNRGLPSKDNLLWQQVSNVVAAGKLAEQFGVNTIPTPVNFVDALKRSGLLERVGDRYLFFHDSFEDWLLAEALAS